ncbi:MAG: hypothetical protein UR26_C0002G0027 [candidate division TM6 bacterium GW2011_GWF2_32_72]|nr:MAG: hypothetical protein UR26_C0002G0027 [candidate division TM6 bacterium GW2011_GWF2_32_72]
MINSILISFGIYFITLFLIGMFSSFKKRPQSDQDFFLGGRSLGPIATAIAAQASEMSIWLFLALPGTIYLNGLFESWLAVSLVIFMFLNWQIIAPRLRNQTEALSCITLPSFLAKKTNDTSKTINLIGGLFSLFFLTIYITAGLTGLGYLFKEVFNLNFAIGSAIALIIVLTYTVIGGFLAAAAGNLFQGLFLLSTLIIATICAYWFAPNMHLGLQELSSNLFSKNKRFIDFLIIFFSWGIGYFGQPQILLNFMGIKDPKNLNYAKWIGTAWQITALSAAILIGFMGKFYFPIVENHEMIFVLIVRQIFPTILTGFMFCGIMAATLASMNGQIMAATSSFIEDIFKSIFLNYKNLNLLMLSRITMIIITLIALGLSQIINLSILEIVKFAWSGLGATFGPIILFSLFSNKINRNSVILGMLMGGVITILLPIFYPEKSALIYGFILSSLVISKNIIPKRIP